MTFTIESTGQNSANVVWGSVRVPVEWKTEDAKPKLIELAKETITDHIRKQLVDPA